MNRQLITDGEEPRARNSSILFKEAFDNKTLYVNATDILNNTMNEINSTTHIRTNSFSKDHIPDSNVSVSSLFSTLLPTATNSSNKDKPDIEQHKTESNFSINISNNNDTQLTENQSDINSVTTTSNLADIDSQTTLMSSETSTIHSDDSTTTTSPTSTITTTLAAVHANTRSSEPGTYIHSTTSAELMTKTSTPTQQKAETTTKIVSTLDSLYNNGNSSAPSSIESTVSTTSASVSISYETTNPSLYMSSSAFYDDLHAQNSNVRTHPDGDDTYWPVAVAVTVGVPAIIVFIVTITVLHRKRLGRQSKFLASAFYT